jgi:hypothetical protein
VALVKSFTLERYRLDLRAGAFNLLNHPNFLGPYPPATVFGRPQFGAITTAEAPRNIQLALKLSF